MSYMHCMEDVMGTSEPAVMLIKQTKQIMEIQKPLMQYLMLRSLDSYFQ